MQGMIEPCVRHSFEAPARCVVSPTAAHPPRCSHALQHADKTALSNPILNAPCLPLQVFRTEHWARTLGPKRALPLMSVVLAVTMACSLGAAVVAHPGPALVSPGLLRAQR